jgi:uncharacterized membrane-anchored protein YitT (DUF2179 family)
MAMITKEKFLTKQWFRAYLLILTGSFILAAGFVFFINPYHIVPGGVYGIGIVVHSLTKNMFPIWPEGFPIGLFGLLMNIPLTIIGIKILGPRFGVKTIVGFILTSLFMDGLTMMVGENDPLGLQDQILLSTIFGGLLVGFGLGLIFKSKATSGGSDIVAMIFAKYTGLPVGQLLIYVDSVIVLAGLVVFQDWKIPLYSWIVIFITGKVIDVTLQGIGYDKAVLIISDKHELIREKIIHDLNRGGTIFTGTGLFQHNERQMIYTVVTRRELEILKGFIKETDPMAFLTVIEANETIGNGFKPLTES